MGGPTPPHLCRYPLQCSRIRRQTEGVDPEFVDDAATFTDKGSGLYFYFVLVERCARSDRIRKEQQQMGKKLNGEISYCMEQATKRGSGDDRDLGSARSRRDERAGVFNSCAGPAGPAGPLTRAA